MTRLLRSYAEFLSTPSARRATTDDQRGGGSQWNFYPRPPRGGRPRLPATITLHFSISIHALREEGDQGCLLPLYGMSQISIHALREEGDPVFLQKRFKRRVFLSTPSARRATFRHVGRQALKADFYPRPPRGGRQRAAVAVLIAPIFLSTPSARRATAAARPACLRQSGFLSTPSARRATCLGFRSHVLIANFYPRPPRGGRHPQLYASQSPKANFYPRPPRGGRPHTVLYPVAE